jgi:F-type H+-transporting ATPase subunit alpha
MDIRADEISKIIKEQLGGYTLDVDTAEVGTVVSVGDGIAQIHGVDGAMATEMLEFPHGVFGIALNLEEDSVGVVLLGETTKIKEGDTVRRTGRIISVPVGDEMLGRVVNGLGQWSGDRRQGTDHHQPARPDREDRPGRGRPATGEGAAPDRAKSHRRDDSDRARPARADHR